MNVPNCRQARRLLMAYLDSELDATTTLAMSEHFSTCAECRRRLESERVIEQRLVEPLRDETMPGAVWDRLEESLEDEYDEIADEFPDQRVTRMTDWVGRLSFAAAAALLVMTLNLVLDDEGRAAPSGGAVIGDAVISDGLAVRALGAELLGSWYRESGDGLTAVPGAAATFQAQLAAASLPDPGIPLEGMVEDYHPIKLLRSRPVELDGARGVTGVYDCCGAVTSLTVVAYDNLSAATRAALAEQGAQVDLELGGVSVRVARFGPYVVGASSEHSVGLTDDITY